MANITRCVCYSVKFEELKRIAEDKGITSFETLRDERACGMRCKMCVPYIKKMLETGQVEFFEPLE